MKYLFLFILSIFCIQSPAHVTDSIPRMNALIAKKTLAVSATFGFGGGFTLEKSGAGQGFFAGQYGVAAEYFPASRLSVRGGYYITNTASKIVTPGVAKNANTFYSDIHYYPKFLRGYVYGSIGAGFSFARVFDNTLNTYVEKQQITPFIGIGANFPVNKIFRRANANLYFEYFASIPFQNIGSAHQIGLTNPSMSNGGIGIKYAFPKGQK